MSVKTDRKKRLIVIAAGIAALALVAFIGLTRQPKSHRSRQQTSTAGSGLVAVPSVIGVAQDRAVAALAGQKLEGTVVGKEETCSKPAGSVVRQDPAGMTQARVGSAVRLVIAQRTPFPLPENAADTTVLAPGSSHAAAGREARPTLVEFTIAGDPCAAGTVVVSHPTAGREVYELAAGESADRTTLYGPGEIAIQFDSLNKDARLVVRTD